MIGFELGEDFFKDEEKSGFMVGSLMKRCWGAQLQVLQEFDKVCSRHGLKWFAFCGTLLGAVRHKGFIPWDDDIDVCIALPPRKCLSISSRTGIITIRAKEDITISRE